ncbi:MAG: response regulator transcription factor [Nitrospinae bacterium]|nr:response regulator transcription factor [Nitrospinota bacterium]
MAKPKEETKILIADSDEKSLHVISILLHRLGYPNVFEAAKRADAEMIINSNVSSNAGMSGLLGGAAPKEVCNLDLLVLDAGLDGGAGARFLFDLRRRFAPDQLAVLFTTTKENAEALALASKHGANETLLKPFSKEALNAKVETLVGSSRPPVIKSFAFPAPAAKPGAKAADKPAPRPVSLESAAVKAPSKPAPGNGGKAPSTGGVSFHGRATQKVYSTEGEPTAQLIDGQINGHYHEQVNVIGGGQNCYWATQVEGQEKVRLQYVSAKGQPSGIDAKTVPLEEFMYTFVLCDEGNCPIMKRLAGF